MLIGEAILSDSGVYGSAVPCSASTDSVEPMAPKHTLQRVKLPTSSETLLLVDVINPFRFPTARDILPSALTAAHGIAKLKRRFTARGGAVVYANDNYGTWHSDFREILAACRQLAGERGVIANLLAPSPTDIVILKPQHSAFHSTPLQHLLSRMHTTRLVIAGFAADMCVMLTATDARMLGFSVWIPSDCTAAESEERKANTLRQLHAVFKCSVRLASRSGPPAAQMRA